MTLLLALVHLSIGASAHFHVHFAGNPGSVHSALPSTDGGAGSRDRHTALLLGLPFHARLVPPLGFDGKPRSSFALALEPLEFRVQQIRGLAAALRASVLWSPRGSRVFGTGAGRRASVEVAMNDRNKTGPSRVRSSAKQRVRRGDSSARTRRILQSRVARIEQGKQTSVDALIEALAALGATRKNIARVIAGGRQRSC